MAGKTAKMYINGVEISGDVKVDPTTINLAYVDSFEGAAAFVAGLPMFTATLTGRFQNVIMRFPKYYVEKINAET